MSSLQERIAARRAQREQERSFVIPVPGYEDVGLAARYKVLRYEELRDVGRGNEDLEGTSEGELAVFADTLIRACVELLERDKDGNYASLGCRWTTSGVREHLGVDLPEGATARQALFEVFNGPSGGTDLALHFQQYDSESSRTAVAIEKDLSGESVASSEPEGQPISQ